jgi:hypothetical protein
MDDFQKQLLKRLDLLIRLQLDRGFSESPPSMTAIVHRLFDFGFSAPEISSIIGKPLNYVTAMSATKRAKATKAKNSGTTKGRR